MLTLDYRTLSCHYIPSHSRRYVIQPRNFPCVPTSSGSPMHEVVHGVPCAYPWSLPCAFLRVLTFPERANHALCNDSSSLHSILHPSSTYSQFYHLVSSMYPVADIVVFAFCYIAQRLLASLVSCFYDPPRAGYKLHARRLLKLRALASSTSRFPDSCRSNERTTLRSFPFAQCRHGTPSSSPARLSLMHAARACAELPCSSWSSCCPASFTVTSVRGFAARPTDQ